MFMYDPGVYNVNKRKTALYLLRFAVCGALCNLVIVLAKSMMLMMTVKGTCFCYFSPRFFYKMLNYKMYNEKIIK